MENTTAGAKSSFPPIIGALFFVIMWVHSIRQWHQRHSGGRRNAFLFHKVCTIVPQSLACNLVAYIHFIIWIWNGDCAKLELEAPCLYFFRAHQMLNHVSIIVLFPFSPNIPQLTNFTNRVGLNRKSGGSGVISWDRHPGCWVTSSAPFLISFASQKESFKPFVPHFL